MIGPLSMFAKKGTRLLNCRWIGEARHNLFGSLGLSWFLLAAAVENLNQRKNEKKRIVWGESKNRLIWLGDSPCFSSGMVPP